MREVWFCTWHMNCVDSTKVVYPVGSSTVQLVAVQPGGSEARLSSEALLSRKYSMDSGGACVATR